MTHSATAAAAEAGKPGEGGKPPAKGAGKADAKPAAKKEEKAAAKAPAGEAEAKA